MPLTLVLGPANSAKAGEVLGAYAAAARRGALLVVPNALDAEHYRRELAEQGAVLASVLTFAGLAEEIARRTGVRARRLTRLQRERLIERAASAARLEALAGAATTAGFAAAAGELVAELERALISPERFAAAMARWSAQAPARAAHAHDLSALYRAYARELERAGRPDAELFAWRALDALRAAPASWGSDAVFFYGFDDMHRLELDAVETLARIVGVAVMVSLTYEPGRAALRARAPTAEELRQLAGRVVELPAVDTHYAPAARRVLHHLERRLFEPAADGERLPSRGVVRLPSPGVVRLLEAAGELVGAEVLALLSDGVPADEIALVYRSPARALPAVARVFAAYGIPLAAPRRLALATTALGRGLLALARCAWRPQDSPAQELLIYLRTPGVLPRPEPADALELRVRRHGLSSAAQARAASGLALREIDALAEAPNPAEELVRQARRLLAAAHPRAAARLRPEEEPDARGLAALTRGLAELRELGWGSDRDELIALLERLEFDAAPDAGDAVLLTDPLAIRARRFRTVFLCGLQEGEFPRLGGGDPFLPDELRRELAACAGLQLRPREDRLDAERYLFYAALSRATDAVVLSYRSSDEEGNLELPSPFVADVAELLEDDWRERRRRRLLADVVWAEREAPTARELARARAAALSAHPVDRPEDPPARIPGSVACAPGSAAATPDSVESTPDSAESTPDSAARLPDPAMRRLAPATLGRLRHSRVVSAGALELYADCPVKWLVERELRPRGLEPDSEAMRRGSQMHDVLERVLQRLGSAVTPATLPAALAILEQVLAEEREPLAPGRPEPLERAAAAALAAELRRYLCHEAATGCGWPPRGLEVRFGFEEEEGSLPPLRLGEGEQPVLVRGAIDRIDVAADGRRAVVRDYKSSGRPEHSGIRWSSGRQLQVALYMLAVRQLLGLEPVAGVYQPLRGSDLRARGMFLQGEAVGAELVATDARDPEALRAALADAAERAVALAGRLRAGDLRPCPETCSRQGCLYPSICRST